MILKTQILRSLRLTLYMFAIFARCTAEARYPVLLFDSYKWRSTVISIDRQLSSSTVISVDGQLISVDGQLLTVEVKKKRYF